MVEQLNRVRRRNNVFGTREYVTTFQLETNYNSVNAAVTGLRNRFQEIWRGVAEDLGPRSYVTMSLHSNHMVRDIDLGRYVRANADVMTQFLNRVETVLQSNEEIYGDQAMTLTVFTVDIPQVQGEGRNKPCAPTWAKRRKASRSVVAIENRDYLCGVYSLMVGYRHLFRLQDKKQYVNVRKYHNARRKDALYLLALCGLQEKDITSVGNELLERFAEKLNIQICVWDVTTHVCSFKTSRFHWQQVHLALHNNHFDAIVSITGFLSVRAYCPLCHTGLKCAFNRHRCKFRCSQCHSTFHDTRYNPQSCTLCLYSFANTECFQNHLKTDVCSRRRKCSTCHAVIRDKEPHVCYHSKCVHCKEWMQWESHKCYHSPCKPKPKVNKLIFFDFESNISKDVHIINYGVGVFVNQTKETEDWVVWNNEGHCILEEFCNWVFQPQHDNAVVMAHNGRGYDYYPIFRYLITQGIMPTYIRRGTKLLCMQVQLNRCTVRFIDSLSFMQVALSQLPKMFGVSNICKGDFPHLFNTPANWHYKGDIPALECFMPSMLTQNKHAALVEWHNAFDEEWVFQKEIHKYCKMDVTILKTCCLAFQNIFFKTTGVDPFAYITISAACMAVFKSRFLRPNTIAVLYKDRNMNTSRASTRFMDYVVAHHEHSQYVCFAKIQGEAKIEGYFVDGFCTKCKTVWEFHGCYFHGCERCYPQFRQKRETTQQKTAFLRSKGYTVVEMWECNWYADVQAQKWCTQHPRTVWTKMNPRDGFFGGRTETFRLHAKGKIRYVDFTSLYPWVNKYCVYPIGHPQKLSGCKKLKQRVLNREIFGMVYALVLPPRQLWLPVLPFKAAGRLVFGLCYACANTHSQECHHNNSERVVPGVWCTPELYQALDEGYTLVHVIEAHHFAKQEKGLFKDYVNTFLKQKQQASGWPQTVIKNKESRADYIDRYYQKEGIQLEEKNIEHNPGLRTVNKLCLNSFWGRWGMKESYSQSVVMQRPEQLWNLLEDVRFEVEHVLPLGPGSVRVDYCRADQFCNGSGHANVYIACFTTSWARLRLYNTMKQVGRRVLYCDTDSLIYEEDDTPNLELGEYLGDLTDELPADTFITTFVSAGPKNYGYELNNGKKIVKVKGFNLHKCIHKDKITLQSMLRTIDTGEQTILDVHQIQRNPQSIQLQTVHMTKVYQKVFTKRRELDNYHTLPWGFRTD